MLRVSVRDSVGAQLAARFGVRAVPTLIVWRDGEAAFRAVGSIDGEAVVKAAAP